MLYDTASAAQTLAEICGGLAGFAFAALTFLMPLRLNDEGIDEEEAQILGRLAEIMKLAFFGLIASAVLQAIRGGISQTGVQTMILTTLVDFVMVTAILMLYAGFLLMASQFLKFGQRRNTLRDFSHTLRSFNLFDVACFIALMFMLVILRGLWQTMPEINVARWTLLTIVLTTTLYWVCLVFSHLWFVQHETWLYPLLITYVLGLSGVAAVVWGTSETAFSVETDVVIGGSLFAMALLVFVSAWMREVFVTAYETE